MDVHFSGRWLTNELAVLLVHAVIDLVRALGNLVALVASRMHGLAVHANDGLRCEFVVLVV